MHLERTRLDSEELKIGQDESLSFFATWRRVWDSERRGSRIHAQQSPSCSLDSSRGCPFCNHATQGFARSRRHQWNGQRSTGSRSEEHTSELQSPLNLVC